jgi:hypothetical protein
MSKQTEHDPEQKKDSEPDGALQLIISMADTTWRMFTPPAIFVPAAIWADLHWGTKPWLTLISVPISLAISVMLVKKQLEKGK